MDIAKQLIVKIKTCKREMDSYQEEADQQQARIERIKDDLEKNDPGRLRQEVDCLNESLAMIPDARKRLEGYLQSLIEFMEENPDEIDGTPEHTEAKDIVANVQARLQDE